MCLVRGRWPAATQLSRGEPTMPTEALHSLGSPPSAPPQARAQCHAAGNLQTTAAGCQQVRSAHSQCWSQTTSQVTLPVCIPGCQTRVPGVHQRHDATVQCHLWTLGGSWLPGRKRTELDQVGWRICLNRAAASPSPHQHDDLKHSGTFAPVAERNARTLPVPVTSSSNWRWFW